MLYSQILPIFFLDDHHFGYNTKLRKENTGSQLGAAESSNQHLDGR
jgi:hypothetical protein